MKRLTWALLLAAVASFSIYWLASESPVVAFGPVSPMLARSGLAWADGNATAAFFLFNGSRPMSVDVAIFRERMPSTVWVWAESDQEKFEAFFSGLQERMAAQSMDVRRGLLADLLDAEPGILLVAGSAIPSGLVANDSLIRLLDRGWVVLYSGFPLSLMRADGRIVANPRWPAQREMLGFDLDSADAVSDYRLSARRGSSWSSGRGQVLARPPGTLVVFPGLLDTIFSNAPEAADYYSAFIGQANWTRSLVSFSANVTPGQYLFSPVFDDPAQEAWIWTHEPGMARQRARLQPSSLRILHPSVFRAGRPLSVSLLSNLSVPASFELSVLNGSRALHRQSLGAFQAGLTWHSRTAEWELAAGDYLLSAAGSDGTTAYSVLHLYSHRVQVEFADLSSKTISARLWAGITPAGNVALTWKGQSFRTDSEGRFRVVDADLSSGVNAGSIDVEGTVVPFDYSVSAGLLASWPDRLLAFGAVGLFGTAWWLRRHSPIHLRLLPPVVHLHRTAISKQQVVQALEHGVSSPTRRMPLSVKEFSCRLRGVLRDPLLVLPDESVARLLHDAASAGFVIFNANFVALRSWYASDGNALQAIFWRRLADRLLSEGWTFSRKGNCLTCRRGGVIRRFDVDPTHGRIRKSGVKAWGNLDGDWDDVLR